MAVLLLYLIDHMMVYSAVCVVLINVQAKVDSGILIG